MRSPCTASQLRVSQLRGSAAVWPPGHGYRRCHRFSKEQRAVDGFLLGSLPDGDALDAFVRQFDLIALLPVYQTSLPHRMRTARGGLSRARSKSHTQRSSNVMEGPDDPCGDRHHGKTTTCELAVAMLRAGGILACRREHRRSSSSKLLSSLSMRT